jgi:uncharacterized damage-inducible protein DinB
MSLQSLKKLYDVNAYALDVNVEGLSHEESLLQPGGGGNCLNWVVGHIVANRNHILSLLGEKPIWGEEAYERYKRGSAPIPGDGGGARPLAEMMADFATSQGRVRDGLSRMTEEHLAASAGKETVGDQLAFLQFHEAYHIGQAGLLRRLAGKDGAIR